MVTPTAPRRGEGGNAAAKRRTKEGRGDTPVPSPRKCKPNHQPRQPRDTNGNPTAPLWGEVGTRRPKAARRAEGGHLGNVRRGNVATGDADQQTRGRSVAAVAAWDAPPPSSRHGFPCGDMCGVWEAENPTRTRQRSRATAWRWRGREPDGTASRFARAWHRAWRAKRALR